MFRNNDDASIHVRLLLRFSSLASNLDRADAQEFSCDSAVVQQPCSFYPLSSTRVIHTVYIFYTYTRHIKSRVFFKIFMNNIQGRRSRLEELVSLGTGVCGPVRHRCSSKHHRKGD